MAALKVELRDFAGMSTEEERVWLAIESSPGMPARDLARILRGNMNRLLKVVDGLVDRGLVYSRLETRVRKDGRRGSYNGLFVAAAHVEAVTPQVSPASAFEAVPSSQASGSDSTPPPAAPQRSQPSPSDSAIARPRRKPKAAPQLNPRRQALLELGKRLGWSRLPLSEGTGTGDGFTPGRSIAGGEEAWAAAAAHISDEDVEMAHANGARLAALLGV